MNKKQDLPFAKLHQYVLSMTAISSRPWRVDTWIGVLIIFRVKAPRHWPFVRGIHQSPVTSLHKGQWRGTLMFSLICAWINGWVNNVEASDLIRHRTHYIVTVMDYYHNKITGSYCLGYNPSTLSGNQGVVSLTFHELSKIISRKYTMPEITFTVRIPSWSFVCVPKAWLWAHVQSFSLKFSLEIRFLQYTNFERISWRARETLVKQPAGHCNSFADRVPVDEIFRCTIFKWIGSTSLKERAPKL